MVQLPTPVMTVGHETRWAYSTTFPSHAHGN